MSPSIAVAVVGRLELDLAVHVLHAAGYDITIATSDPTALLTHSWATPADVTVMSREFDGSPGGLIGPLLRTGTRVLVVGSGVAAEEVAVALLNGASGFVRLDSSSPHQLSGAVADVAAGAASLHPEAAYAILEQWRQFRQNPTSNKAIALTSREQDILYGLAEGATVKQLARRLQVAEKTVEAHKTRLYVKLGTRSQGQAVAEGIRLGLIVPDGGERFPDEQ